MRAPKDKMMKSPPVSKGFHFASDGVHAAMFVEATSIEQAEAIYHKTKKPLGVGGTESTPTQVEDSAKDRVQ